MLRVLRQRNFALLWTASLISQIGDWVLIVALPFYVYSLTGSVLATSTTLIVEMLPRIVLGSIAGVFADRWDRKRTMIVADFSRAVILLALLFVHSADQLLIVYVVAFTQSCISQFFFPASHAVLPSIVRRDDLVTANSTISLADAVTRIAGPSLGGAMLGVFGLTSVVLIDSGSFLLSGLMIAAMRLPRKTATDDAPNATESATTAWAGVWQEWRAGLGLVIRSKILGALFATMGIFMLGQGILNVLLIVFVREVLEGGAQVYGWLATAQGVGALVGALVLAERLGSSARPTWLMAIGLIGAGALLGVISNVPVLGLILAIIGVLGILAVVITVSMQTLLQIIVTDSFLGRVFGAYNMFVAVTSLIGMSLAAVGNKFGVVAALNFTAVLWLVTGLFALLAFPRVKA